MTKLEKINNINILISNIASSNGLLADQTTIDGVVPGILSKLFQIRDDLSVPEMLVFSGDSILIFSNDTVLTFGEV